jgi:hypothetical protein
MVATTIASMGSMPSAMARRMTWSMWPSCMRSPGVAVVRAEAEPVQRLGPDGGQQGLEVSGGRAFPDVDLHAQRDLFLGLLAGETLVIGLDAGGPHTPGARAPANPGRARRRGRAPGRRRPWRGPRGRRARRRGSSSSRPGRGPGGRREARPPPRGPGSRRRSPMWDAGTHEEAIHSACMGAPAASSISMRTPGRPSTLAISCGSSTAPVVPRATASRANSPGMSIVDSTCMCASRSPGTAKAPAASSRSRASMPEPSAATRPRTIAMEPRSTRRVNTLTTRALSIARSAAASPRAAARNAGSVRGIGLIARSLYAGEHPSARSPRAQPPATRFRPPAVAGRRPCQARSAVLDTFSHCHPSVLFHQ